MRDGMNLVAKEFVASKIDGKGVLVLSEMAGASRELSDALMVNPNDIWDFAEKIYLGLTMPEDEQRQRMAAMQQTVSRFDIHRWVNNFFDKLAEVKISQQDRTAGQMNPAIALQIQEAYVKASRRLILLDYDGTLVPFFKQVMDAFPDTDLINLIASLTADPLNNIVITSGRDYATLDLWLGQLHLDMIAEHGAWYRDQGGEWKHRRDLNTDWKPEILNVMNLHTSRTPGAFIEEKSYSLAWHYRKVEAGLGALRANELMSDMHHFISSKGLQIMQGDKVIEVKSMAVNKGRAARRWLERETYDFILAIGDDYTDEDTFKEMPASAFTIKVGTNISAARYYVSGYPEVRRLLASLGQAASVVSE
jgi:trehalose 6-phosphate synthase/phosphatase